MSHQHAQEIRYVGGPWDGMVVSIPEPRSTDIEVEWVNDLSRADADLLWGGGGRYHGRPADAVGVITAEWEPYP